MPQLINNYASSFLHSLSGRGDGYGADTLSLLMPPNPTSFLTYSVTMSIRAPLWLAANPEFFPFPMERVISVCGVHADRRNVP